MLYSSKIGTSHLGSSQNSENPKIYLLKSLVITKVPDYMSPLLEGNVELLRRCFKNIYTD